jgi:hypothetical protein
MAKVRYLLKCIFKELTLLCSKLVTDFEFFYCEHIYIYITNMIFNSRINCSTLARTLVNLYFCFLIYEKINYH